MANRTYKLGDLIELSDERNSDNKYSLDDVRGISTEKQFIETKANMDGVSLASYKVVNRDDFAYVADTSRRGDKIALAYNKNNSVLISSVYTVFRISKKNILNSDYLFMYFNRSEFDRFSRFNSWGSARETFSWNDFCDIDIELPPLKIQRKYVDVYNAMLENQKSYERGLDDLKLTCDAYIENLRKKYPCEKIGKYIEESDLRNEDEKYKLENLKGISIEKKFIETKADMQNVSLKPYLLVKPNYFCYVPVTSRNGEKITLAINSTGETFIVSSAYTVFKVKKELELNPQYLMMFFNRSEFDRYSRFNSWGSARETFDWTEMCDVQIPISPIEVQQSIANIYKVYNERKEINQKLKFQLKSICTILIKGSLEDA